MNTEETGAMAARQAVAEPAAAERQYLGEQRLARLATADAQGKPQVTPVGMWRYDAESGTVTVGGHSLGKTRKVRNISVNPNVALVVDDVASVNPWRPRAVIVEGPAALEVTDSGDTIIRIYPDTFISWGLDEAKPA